MEYAFKPAVCQTAILENSHYNTTHYNNPNFQPEEQTLKVQEAADKAEMIGDRVKER